MGLFTKDVETLNDAFVARLQIVYYAEKQIAEALPTMIDKSTAPELKSGLDAHLRETRNQIARLEQVFRMHDAEAKESNCPAIDGLIKGGNGAIGNTADPQVLDAVIASCAQLVEHYEIAQYGTLVAWARELGREDCAKVLNETLSEEKAADERLTRLAEGRINRAANQKAA